MFDINTLKPLNCYKLLETLTPHKFGLDVVILKASNNSYRFCHRNSQGGTSTPFDSCLIVEANKTIKSVYTQPGKRRRGIARQLLLVARLTIGNVYHSDNLTVTGRKWRDSVENIKNKC
jgi:hypothetical protein